MVYDYIDGELQNTCASSSLTGLKFFVERRFVSSEQAWDLLRY